MGSETKIEWCDHTASPWYGCQHAELPGGGSHPGCDHCYAEALSKRNPATLGEWGSKGRRVLSASFWRNCRAWNKKAAAEGRIETVFPSLCDPFEDWQVEIRNSKGNAVHRCESCGDTFGVSSSVHPLGVACACGGLAKPLTMADLRRDLFALIDECPNLRFLLLTKRPQNIRRMWAPVVHQSENWFFDPAAQKQRGLTHAGPHKSTLTVVNGDRPNVWLFTSVSDQPTADAMIPELLKCRDLAPVLGLSIEPLVGSVDLLAAGALMASTCACDDAAWSTKVCKDRSCHEQTGSHGAIDWVIVGGESGAHARPMHPQWARDIRDQCVAAGVPFFFKQWGEWVGYEDDTPPLIRGQDGQFVDRHTLPAGLIEHEPVNGWYWPCDPEHLDVIYRRVGKHAAGRLLDGRTHDEFPQTTEDR